MVQGAAVFVSSALLAMKKKFSDMITKMTATTRCELPSTEPLRVVSMNICLGKPSNVAPIAWTKEDQTNMYISELLIRSQRQGRHRRPHILALQECPSIQYLEDNFVSEGYHLVGTQKSHCGLVALLIHSDLIVHQNDHNEDERRRVSDCGLRVPLPYDIPAVMAKCAIRIDDNDSHKKQRIEQGAPLQNHERLDEAPGDSQLRYVAVASVHLAPFGGGDMVRRRRVEEIMAIASSLDDGNDVPLLFAGDTNMRVAEDNFFEEELGLLDAWKQTGSNPKHKFTWDTVDHTTKSNKKQQRPFNDQRDYYNEYYGRETRQYNARYDRMYYSQHPQQQQTTITNDHNSNNDSSKSSSSAGGWGLHATDFRLIANHPIPPSKNHFLSDHFGIIGEFRINNNNDDRCW